MEESGSVGLDELVNTEFAAGGFYAAAEAICIADNYWLDMAKPCVQHGLRGICYFFVHVTGPKKDVCVSALPPPALLWCPCHSTHWAKLCCHTLRTNHHHHQTMKRNHMNRRDR